jgi:hypothetical protein
MGAGRGKPIAIVLVSLGVIALLVAVLLGRGPLEEQWVRYRALRTPEPNADWLGLTRIMMEQRLDFTFKKRPLAEILAFLGESSGATLLTDRAVDLKARVEEFSMKDVSLAKALEGLCVKLDLAYFIRTEGVVLVNAARTKNEGVRTLLLPGERWAGNRAWFEGRSPYMGVLFKP